jgi:hypothetical protein
MHLYGDIGGFKTDLKVGTSFDEAFKTNAGSLDYTKISTLMSNYFSSYCMQMFDNLEMNESTVEEFYSTSGDGSLNAEISISNDGDKSTVKYTIKDYFVASYITLENNKETSSFIFNNNQATIELPD